MPRLLRFLLPALSLAACGGDDGGFESYTPEPGTPESIAFEAGITRHLGAIRPSSRTVDGPNTTYTFDPSDGPICMRGDEFSMSVQERAGDDLLIFLQGGGACWSDFCLAVTKAIPDVPDNDILLEEERNPAGDFDVVYVPYCDASLFAGQSEVDEDGDGEPDRFHHGLANLSAALTQGYRHFPEPGRIVLAGSSGGGFGTILATFLVRYVYPDVPIYVLNDAGIGVAQSADPEFVGRLLDDFGARDFVPDDCPDCIADGHVTGLIDYALERDPNLRVAAISSWYDSVISQTFLMLDPATFATDVDSETTELLEAHPERYRRFLYEGQAHTALLNNVNGVIGGDFTAVEFPPGVLMMLSGLSIESMYSLESEGVLLRDWVAAMLENDLDGWVDVRPDPGPPPTMDEPAP
ncbi:MAG: vtpJ-therm [Deltaproteobacteria bacterium]|nr:vtpJ-therm [Deltaproteobacteria bacterium]